MICRSSSPRDAGAVGSGPAHGEVGVSGAALAAVRLGRLVPRRADRVSWAAAPLLLIAWTAPLSHLLCLSPSQYLPDRPQCWLKSAWLAHRRQAHRSLPCVSSCGVSDVDEHDDDDVDEYDDNDDDDDEGNYDGGDDDDDADEPLASS